MIQKKVFRKIMKEFEKFEQLNKDKQLKLRVVNPLPRKTQIDILNQTNKNQHTIHEELTLDQLQGYLRDIFKKRVENKTLKRLSIRQGCKTYGWVDRSPSTYGLNICPDPTCPSCSMLSDMIKEDANKYFDEEQED